MEIFDTCHFKNIIYFIFELLERKIELNTPFGCKWKNLPKPWNPQGIKRDLNLIGCITYFPWEGDLFLKCTYNMPIWRVICNIDPQIELYEDQQLAASHPPRKYNKWTRQDFCKWLWTMESAPNITVPKEAKKIMVLDENILRRVPPFKQKWWCLWLVWLIEYYVSLYKAR